MNSQFRTKKEKEKKREKKKKEEDIIKKLCLWFCQLNQSNHDPLSCLSDL